MMNLPKKPLFFLLISSLILFILSFLYFLFLNNDQVNNTPYYKVQKERSINFTTITRREFWSKQIPQNKKFFIQGKKIEETFIAQSNNLGIIEIPFNTNNKSINEKIVFRLKEVGEKKWYFQATYDARQVQNDIPFPFGFPVINNSKNKHYIFQLEPLVVISGDFLSLSDTSNFFLTKYKYSRLELIRNPNSMFEFIVTKIREKILPPMLITVLFFFIFPFIIYLISVYLIRKFNIKLRKKTNLISQLTHKIKKHLSFIEKATITYPLNRENKIKLCCLIISIGFTFSIFYHYFQSVYYKQVWPLNSFLPANFFGDFFLVFEQWNKFKFTGVGYGLSYFPGTYLVVDLFVRFFNVYKAVFILLTSFTFFLYFYTYKNIKTNRILESLQNAFIISLMSYPFLISFQTANVEIITFMSVSLFFLFYRNNRLLSIIFLSYAISMKAFPGIFIVLLLLEKRYKEIFLTCIFVIFFTLLPLLIFDGGFNKGIGNYVTNLKESQNMYFDLMIITEAGNHYGHSLLNGIRTLMPNLISSMKTIIFPYEMFALAVFLVVVGYLKFNEKRFWKKVASLVMMMNLLPFTSTDYKLLYIFFPLFFFINSSRREKYDLIYLVLLSLLLIPKDYFYFNNNLLSTFNVILNPLIMLTILLMIFFSGIKINLVLAKNRINKNKLFQKGMKIYEQILQ